MSRHDSCVKASSQPDTVSAQCQNARISLEQQTVDGHLAIVRERFVQKESMARDYP